MNRKAPIWIPITIALIFLVSGGFSGNYFLEYKKEVEEKIRKNDSIYAVRELKIDSLINISEQEEAFSNKLRLETERLRIINNNIYYELKNRKAEVFIIDTAFISNARRISESSHRFYRSNDSIR
tara:strand:+ start:24 stop:398 length:375 start_codon:yes stop_codon:yes gene_type:complete